jgi:hypothetical protein
VTKGPTAAEQKTEWQKESHALEGAAQIGGFNLLKTCFALWARIAAG